MDIIHHKRFDVPESALAPVVIYHLVFDVNFMGVRLSDHDQSSFGFRRSPLFDSVIASDVPRIRPWEVWRLNSTRLPVTLVQYPVAVAPLDH